MEQLTAFTTCPESAQSDTLKKVLELCSSFHINLKHMTLSLTLYKRCKDEYLQDLFKNCRQRMAETNALAIESFDERTKVPSFQKGWFSTLKKSFTFSEKCDTTNSLIFLFQELVDRIHKRVGIPFQDIASVLKLEYKLTDVTELIKAIGYAENPFKRKTRVLHFNNRPLPKLT